MKISKARCQGVMVPEEEAPAGQSGSPGRVWPVSVLEIETDQGLVGIGFAFTLGGLSRSLLAALEELAGRVVGEDPTLIEGLHNRLRQAVGVGANTGVALLAQAAIDMALWDIRGKMAGLPLWRLVGGARAQIPGYSSGAIGRTLTDAEAARAAECVVKAGFRWVKMHLGLEADGTIHREVTRARVVREAVGPDIRLGCDINTRWRVDEAIAIGRELDRLGFSWLEDPVRHDDYRGLARVAAALDTPVMAGENNWGSTPFRLMLEQRSVDMLMIDVMTVGGITEWLKVAAMAESFNIPVVSHLLPEVQAHLVAGVPNGLLAEHKTWIWALFDEVPVFRSGTFHLPERPGLGLSLSKRAMSRR
jgi:L-talarate/galactarate dehydratase